MPFLFEFYSPGTGFCFGWRFSMQSCSSSLPKELCDVIDQAFRVVYFQNERSYLFFLRLCITIFREW
ncbi:hypothetical protein LINGRAHAP2_LOCUS25633 [Linum grandiflorum]